MQAASAWCAIAARSGRQALSGLLQLDGVFGPRKDGWFKDMFLAGFEGEDMPPEQKWRSLQWLGERDGQRTRAFARTMVEHVYYVLTGRKVLLPRKPSTIRSSMPSSARFRLSARSGAHRRDLREGGLQLEGGRSRNWARFAFLSCPMRYHRDNNPGATQAELADIGPRPYAHAGGARTKDRGDLCEGGGAVERSLNPNTDCSTAASTRRK
jgi:hypothetical protein